MLSDIWKVIILSSCHPTECTGIIFSKNTIIGLAMTWSRKDDDSHLWSLIYIQVATFPHDRTVAQKTKGGDILLTASRAYPILRWDQRQSINTLFFRKHLDWKSKIWQFFLWSDFMRPIHPWKSNAINQLHQFGIK